MTPSESSRADGHRGLPPEAVGGISLPGRPPVVNPAPGRRRKWWYAAGGIAAVTLLLIAYFAIGAAWGISAPGPLQRYSSDGLELASSILEELRAEAKSDYGRSSLRCAAAVELEGFPMEDPSWRVDTYRSRIVVTSMRGGIGEDRIRAEMEANGVPRGLVEFEQQQKFLEISC